ncbi:MAG: family 43 glycosylhydrolase, partial [Cytophagales bacterium]|nr:family 43 glycosylhydrolase [Armatimonadota bacterium]
MSLILIVIVRPTGSAVSLPTPEENACPCSASPLQTPPPAAAPPTAVPTPLPRVHDPVLAKEARVYYLFSTGRGITLHTSKDRVTWQRKGRVFAQPMPWTVAAIPGSTESYWAPDISFFNGK